LFKVKYYTIERLNIEEIIMWVITKDDSDNMMPDVLTDEDGSMLTFIDKGSAWKYIETLCYDNGVPFSFLDYSDITLYRLQ
jgi:hypothetical protein